MNAHKKNIKIYTNTKYSNAKLLLSEKIFRVWYDQPQALFLRKNTE